MLIILALARVSAPDAPETSTATAARGLEARLEAVVVTGSRQARRLLEEPVGIEVLTREEILSLGAENAGAALEKMPGVGLTRSFAGHGIQLQGLDSQHVLVLVDGQRVAGRKDGVIDLSRFATERIERIELVKGAASSLYGSDAVGGVVNIITREPEAGAAASVHSVYGSRNRIDTSGQIELGNRDLAARISGGFHRSDAALRSSGSPVTSFAAFDEGNAELRALWRGSETMSLDLRADLSQRSSAGVDGSVGGALFDRRNRSLSYSGSLSPTWRLGDTQLRGSLYLTSFHDDFLQDQRSSNEFIQQTTVERLAQLSAQVDHHFSAAHLTSFGVDGLLETIESSRLEGGAGDRARLSVFGQHEWSIVEEPWLVLVPSARLDLDSQFGRYLTPKLAARLDLGDWAVLRFSLGTAFRAPSFRELLLLFENPSAGYVVSGNPELAPETSRSLQAGLELRPWSGAWLLLNLYRNDIDNLIMILSDASGGFLSRFAYRNVARALTQGLEATLRVEPTSWLELEGSYTYLDGIDLDAARPLEGRAPHRVTYRLRAWSSSLGGSLALRGTWVSVRPFYDQVRPDGTIGPVEAPAYQSFDLRLEQSLGQHLSAFAGIDNVLGAGTDDPVPLAPRTFYFGLDGRL